MQHNAADPLAGCSIRIMEQRDSRAFLQLITGNRERLQPYFPMMCRTLTGPFKTWLFVYRKRAEFFRRRYFPFVIERNATGELLGYISIRTIDDSVPKGELAYFIDAASEGKGIITAALREVAGSCFKELGFNKLIIRVNASNPGSRAVAVKAGFTSEGIQQSDFRNHEGQLIASEYLGKSKS